MGYKVGYWKPRADCHPMDTRGKAAETLKLNNHSVKVKNAWSNEPIHPHATLMSGLIKHNDTFYLCKYSQNNAYKVIYIYIYSYIYSAKP